MTAGASCPLPVAPLCDIVSGAGTGLTKDILSAIVSWIVAGASWLLNQLGSVMTSSTSVHLGASWFHQHYAVMASLAAVVAVPMFLLATIQGVYQQSAAVLIRSAFVHLPLAGLLTAVAVQLVQLSLTVTDALCSAVAQGSGNDIDKTLASVATILVTSGPSLPSFVLGLGALLVVIGALALWLELIVRSAAVYVAVLFLPLAMASLVWPAVSHWCRRLVEALASIVLSKFVVVAVLSLAIGALANGTGFSTLLTAGALLLLAAFMPFTLLRLVPMIESGAALQLEGARQRLSHTAGPIPRSAASFAVRAAWSEGLPMGEPGEGTNIDPGLPGSDDAVRGLASPGDRAGGGPPDAGGAAMVGSGDDAGGPGGGSGHGGGAMEEMTETMRNGLWPLGLLPPEAFPGTRRLPPGDIPLWPGDQEYTEAFMRGIGRGAVLQPRPLVSDNDGGWSAVPSGLDHNPNEGWGTSEQAVRDLSFEAPQSPSDWPTRHLFCPAEPPIETPEAAAMWDRAVARDTNGDDAW